MTKKFILFIVVVCLLTTVTGCVVTAWGQRANHRCGPNCPGHPPATAKQIPQIQATTSLPAQTVPRTVRRNTTLPNPVAQVAYTAPSAQKLSEPKRLSSAPATQASLSSKANPDLHKPWNMEEFRPVSARTRNPYRLVSDMQTSSSRSAPPVMDLNRLTGSENSPQIRQSVSFVQPVVTAGQQRRPILGLGRDLLHEFRASNDRQWSQNHAVLQTASFDGNLVTIHNVRYSKYDAGQVTTTRYYDATFNLDEIRTIDLVIVPFKGAPRLAHVQSSFGFADGRHIGMSISKPDMKKAKNTMRSAVHCGNLN